MVEHAAVNRVVVGSSPTSGANTAWKIRAPTSADLPPRTTSVLSPEGWSDACKALADAANALSRVASALGGSRPPDPAPLTHSPAPHPPDTTVGVIQAINELIVSKTRAGRSDEYIRQLRHCYTLFSRGLSRRPLASITVAEIDAFLARCQGAPRTRKGRIQYLRVLFGFGMRRGYCSTDPASAVDFPTQSSEPPGIHTPEQVTGILEAARAWSPRLTRVLAIRYFAGLRAAEIARLDEGDIGPKYIVIPAAKAKTRSRRLVTIQPNLAKWLELGGTLPGQTCEQQIWELSRKTGIPWPRNVARHSFVSYHLAAFGSASQTALQAGHTESVLFAHYREVVTPEAAAQFWAIVPTAASSTPASSSIGSPGNATSPVGSDLA